MYECSSCILRLMRAVAGDAIPASRVGMGRLSAASHPLASRSSRRYASTFPDEEPYLNAKQLRHVAEKSATAAVQPDQEDSSRSRNELRTKYRALKKELDYLGDPLKLSEHINYVLRRQNPEKALELVRVASRTTQCTVSWNHIINWHMQKGKVNEAMKIYNEMKKRAQFPDNYTYMLLIRGLAGGSNHHRTPEAKAENAAKAVSIYNIMSGPNSRIKPTIMHTNAVLRVCSFSFDLDPFWAVASKIPKSGPASADHITYTTILTAIRHGAISKHVHDAAPAQIETIRRRAAEEGKMVWRDVVAKWRSGEVTIDEELTCSMARVLLISPDIQDWDYVLDLVHQTTKVERLLPPLGSPDRKSEHVPRPTEEGQELSTEAEKKEDEEGYTETKTVKIFNPVNPLPRDAEHPQRPKSLAYPTLGNRTLSCLIDACTLMRAPKAANAYWDCLIADPINLKPDLPNFHSLLKLLSRNRASGRAAKILSEDLPAAEIQPQNMTITLAMGACLRDNKNHGVLAHARTIVDVMETRMANLDVHVLESYLNLAMVSAEADKNPESAAAKLNSVIDHFDPLTHNLRSRVTFGKDDDLHLADKERIVGFLQRLVGVMDMMRDQDMVAADKQNQWSRRRSQLVKFIGNTRERLIKLGSRMRAHAASTSTTKEKDGSNGKASPNTHTAFRRISVGNLIDRGSDPSPIPEFAAGMDRGSPQLMRFRMKKNPGRRERAEKKMAREDDDFVSWSDVSHSR